MQRVCQILMICGLCVFLMGCPSLGAPFGYPRMWDYTRKEPTAASLAGTYHIRQVRTVDIGGASSTIQNFRNRQDVSVTINPDHMAILSNIPDFDICGGKEISTAATWKLLGNDWEIRCSWFDKGDGCKIGPMWYRLESRNVYFGS